jgi:hypothetical protein
LRELKDLEEKKHEWLDKEEHIWRLKSRALWLKAGNNNTKYFHQFANFRKNTNTISDIKNAKG